MREMYHGYFYILERDTTRCVTRFADPRFCYVESLNPQGSANRQKSGYGCGISERTELGGGVGLRVGQPEGDARLRLTFADMKTLRQHGE